MKFLNEILAECSDQDASRWLDSVKNGEWPSDMPIPSEALRMVWRKLQERVHRSAPRA